MTVDTGASGVATVYRHVEALHANVADGEPNATGFAVSARWQSAVETRSSYVNGFAGELRTAFAAIPKTDGGRGW